MARSQSGKSTNSNGAALGFEATLRAAEKLRGNLHPAEYKNIVLGLIHRVTPTSVGRFGSGNGQHVPTNPAKPKYASQVC